MSIIKIRKPETPFEVIDSASIASIKNIAALAIWVYLRAKPEGWVVRGAEVMDHFGIGRDSYRAAIKKLAEMGAVEDRRIRGTDGRIITRELVVNYCVNREPENTSHGEKSWEPSKTRPSHREPEIPTDGKNRVTVKPTDGKSAPLYNTDLLDSTEKACARPAKPQTEPADFSAFWSAYPRKTAKAQAVKAWTKAKLNSQTVSRVLADITRRTGDDPQWADPGFIPYPATYLNNRRWEDEIPQQPSQQQKRPRLIDAL